MNYEKAYQVAIKDIGRYYFIAYSILKDPSVYTTIEWSPDEKTAILIRKSGTLQLLTDGECVTPASAMWLQKSIRKHNWKSIVALKMHLEFLTEHLEGLKFRKGSYIARCEVSQWTVEKPLIQPSILKCEDLSLVEDLYKEVFPGYAPLKYMRDKIQSGRGRGVVICEDNRVVAVAQSDFEAEGDALIVGVATDLSVRGKGYGKACMQELSNALISEGKRLSLIYENPIAGQLYEKLGFKIYDRLYHLERN